MKKQQRVWPITLIALSVALAYFSGRPSQATELAARNADSAGQRPNIVLIMTDDQGYGDLGITGNPIIDTPNIDRLGMQSASMTDFYVCPVCSPTRASLMTGRYHYRTRVVDTFKGRSMMDPSEVTVAELLSEAGYATGIFGKWHLGDNYPMRPSDQGFEESYIHRGGGLAQPSEPLENARRYTNPILFHNNRQIQTKGYCTDLYFEAAQQFIRKCHDAKRPFFVYLPTNAPHGPYHDVPSELYEKYKKVDLSSVLGGRKQDADRVARIYAMIENVDENVGRLRKLLTELGAAKNTIVIFMVDNGPNTRRYVGPFRGMKSEVHEGGIRSPFYLHWPSGVRAGATSDRIAAHIDVAPTLLDAAGVAPPKDLKMDGRSLLPLLQQKAVEWPDRHIVLQVHRGDSPIGGHHFAIRNQQWKLVHPTGFGREQMPPNIAYELYDMSKDSREEHNLFRSRPEIATAMLDAYKHWFADVSSTRDDNYAPPRIFVGSDLEPESVLSLQDWRVVEPQGWGRNGRWLIDVVTAGMYQAELIVQNSVETATVTLIVDKQEHSRRASKFQRLRMPPVQLKKGPASIGVRVEKPDGKTVAPYHVVLRRVE